MNDDKLSNLIQKIGHHIDDIRDRSVTILIQKYEKSLIDETDFKKRNYFFYIILHYINDRNSYISLKSLRNVFSFVHSIIKKDEEIKKKFEEIDISKFMNEFLIHFKNNEEKYKSNNLIINSEVKNDINQKDDTFIKNYEKSLIENSNNEYYKIITILGELINLYQSENKEILKFNNNENSSNQKEDKFCHIKNKDNKNPNVNNEKNLLTEHNLNRYNKTNVKKKEYFEESSFTNINDQLNENDLGRELVETNINNNGKLNILNIIYKSDLNLKNKEHIKNKTPEFSEKKEKLNSHDNSFCKNKNSVYKNTSLSNHNNNISEKDRMDLNQIIKKNNCINIFTKNNCTNNNEFEYYNALCCIKNKVNEKLKYLLLNYKKNKATKKKEYNTYYDYVIPTFARKDINNINYARILNNYTFFYLYNFFDSFCMFKKNFMNINNIRSKEELYEKNSLKEKDSESIKTDNQNQEEEKKKSIKDKENSINYYSIYLNNNYLYNKNISYKILNYINKMILLIFGMKMKFNYFEILGMNIIKKKISVDDLIYMNKEVNKILNEYIYIFNKDILFFNYKFLYTLSYNIRYIYKSYVENNQLTNDFNHVNNIVSNLSYIIYIIIHSLYISLIKGCICNHIFNIYINNFFFLISQNLFYILFICMHKKNDIHSNNKEDNIYTLDNNKEITQLINNINVFYYNSYMKKLQNMENKEILEINENDMYHYLLITENNCIYFFKFIILYMFEILKISYFKINKISQNCVTLNFQLDNFVVIYDFIYNLLIHYFNEETKQVDEHLEFLIEFVKASNFHQCINKKKKKINTSISEDFVVNELNNFSSTSCTTDDLTNNKLESIEIFSNNTYKYTYKYSLKQIEILKIVCLYINYTPISFIIMKKIKKDLINLLKMFLYDLNLNIYYSEILYFFKTFFFFYDYEIYKEYNDFILYYYSLINLFFMDDKNRLDISTFMSINNNIFHFLFFFPVNYCTLNNFLEKYYSTYIKEGKTKYDNDTFSNENNTSNTLLESFDSLSKSFTGNIQCEIVESEEDHINNLFSFLTEKTGDINKKKNTMEYEKQDKNDDYENKNNFYSKFVQNIMNILIENNLKMMFNSFILLSSEYHNVTNFTNLDERSISMYQFIVDKLKDYNKIYILTFDYLPENQKCFQKITKFVKLFKNFLLLLHNIISLIYNYNTAIVFFFFNFILNINDEKANFFKKEKELSNNEIDALSDFNTYNYELNNTEKINNSNYDEYFEKNMHTNINLNEDDENINYSDTYCYIPRNVNTNKNINKDNKKVNNNNISKNVFNNNQTEYCNTYEDTYLCNKVTNEQSFKKNEDNKINQNIFNNEIFTTNYYEDINKKNFFFKKNKKEQYLTEFINEIDNNSNDVLNNTNNHDNLKKKNYSEDIFLSSFQTYEFIDIIYEICIYSKKEIKNYYIFFILENIKKKILRLFDILKKKDINEKKFLLSNIKICTKILVLLNFIEKKYILIYEQDAYKSFDFLYENYFSRYFILNKREKSTKQLIDNQIYFYQNVFLNTHNIYFYIFQKKKKRRSFSFKIFWKWYHQFKIKFSKVKIDESDEKNLDSNIHIKSTNNRNDNFQKDENFIDNNLCEESCKDKINKIDKNNLDIKYRNIFKYTNDWNSNANILNIYISDFLTKQCITDETTIIETLSNIDINRECCLEFFNHIIVFIIKNSSCFNNKSEKKEQNNEVFLCIYEKVFNLYLKLLKEILIKEETKSYIIEVFIYVLKIIILLLITNYRSSNICKRIYKEKYFFLSHLYCFFFFNNETIKVLCISLCFYLIFDQKILLLNKHRIFLEPYLILEKERKKEDFYSSFIQENNTVFSSSSSKLNNFLIDDIEKEHNNGYIDNIEIPNTCDGVLKNSILLKKYKMNFFNLNRKNKYIENNLCNFENKYENTFYIENKIIYFIPFWLYKKLQPNNFLLIIKKLKSFFFFSTKFSYLHIFHDSNINSKEKELCFFGDYNSNNIFLSFFLFINKYYYLIRNMNNIQIKNNYHQTILSTLKRRNILHKNTEIPIFTTTNINSFLFLNVKVDKLYASGYKAYINNLLSKLKLLPAINDRVDKINFDYIYDLNKLFFILYNYYMGLLYVENNFEKNKKIYSNNSRHMCYDKKEENKKVIDFNKDQIKYIYYLFESDCNEIINIINFVYNYMFSYINKLLFFIYNQLKLINKENHLDKNIMIHKYILLLEHFLNVLDICLYIDLILQKKENKKSKINELNKDIDLFIFIYKLLYISVSTSTLKNKISIFSLNLLYNFIKLENYSLKIKYSCYNSSEDISSDTYENKEKKNYILLKEEAHKEKKISEENKNLSTLVNFLFFIISKFTKKIIKKNYKSMKSTNFYCNIINIYEIEESIDVENVNFQHHEKDYLKIDIFFLKNIMSMLHVIMKKKCFIDIYLKNDDLTYININILKKYDYKHFIDKKIENELNNQEKNNNIPIIQELENSKSNDILDKDMKDLNKFKHIFLNKYMKILISFCNIYNDVVIECLYIQLLLFFFKYLLQLLKAEISKEYLKNNYNSKQKILVYFLKYYKADKHICKYLKKIYFIILKYTIFMQNTKFVKDTCNYQMNEQKWQNEKEDNKCKEKKSEMNKYNYVLKEDEINKNYSKLFYEYTLNKYRNYDEITNNEEYEYSYKKDNLLNSNYICVIDFFCCNCEEQKFLFLSIILFLSFFLDKFPFFFDLENNKYNPKKDENYENKKADNIIILCERILHLLSKKNIYINFSILEEAKLFEKYFIKIFIKLLFYDEKETMNNLQKYEIFFYKKKIDIYMQSNDSKSNLYIKEENEKNNEKGNSDYSNTKARKIEIDQSESTDKNSIKSKYDIINGEKNLLKKRNDNINFYSSDTSMFFTKNMIHENCFYINHFINYFLVKKKVKTFLDYIYDKVYYYILIVSMCFKDKNFLSLLLSKNELFYDEFNKMIQEYLKFVLNNKEEVNKKKKKNEMMIQNLLYIFVSYIYIYLNDLYNIFFTQIKNILILPSFFQNIIYINDTNLNIFYENNTLRVEDSSISIFYESLTNIKKKEWNKNLENYTDENIKNIIINNIFHNNNIYLFILYIINDKKYSIKKEKQQKKNSNNCIVFHNDEDEVKQNFSIDNIHLEFKKNNKIFVNKITTNIILFFLLFFYDYYSYNYEIKENILMQITRHIAEHFISLFNLDFLNIYTKHCEIIKAINLKKKKNIKPLKYELNKNLKIIPEKNWTLKQRSIKNNKNELAEKNKTKKKNVASIKYCNSLRTNNTLSKRMNENKKKKSEEIVKEKKSLERIINEKENIKNRQAKNLEMKREEIKKEIMKLKAKRDEIKEGTKKEKLQKLKKKREVTKDINEEKKKDVFSKIGMFINKNESNELNNEYNNLTINGIYIIERIKEKIKRNKKLLSLYTINCFKIIQIYNNISSLIFKYKYIIHLLQNFSYFTNKNIIECIYNSFNFYLNNYFKGEIKYVDEKNIIHFDKEIGYFSYIYMNYFFNFLCCFILYDISTLYKFCCNTLNCIDILNNYFKDLLVNEKGIHICIIILNFYLIIINSYFFDFSFYENTLYLIEEEDGLKKDKLNIKNYTINYLKNKKNEKKDEITYFICIKKLSNEFNKSKFFLYLINYVINNLGNNINKTKIEIENKNNLIILILQLLSYNIIFIENKNEILKLANILIKYLKKNDDILISYYITIFFNSCFINSFFDERLLNLLFNFDKKDNIWFNLIFLSSNKMKKNKEVLVLIKFSILHMYLLLLKNKKFFKKCILYISSDINIYFVLIYVLNEILENLKNLNNEEDMGNNLKIKGLDDKKNDTNKKKCKKYFYAYVELLIIITEIIKVLNNNDVNKYITLNHNKDKANLTLQFKNLYKQIKNELKHLEELIKLIKYTIFIHPLMINIHLLHKFYLCIYIKEFYYFHKTFFKYDLFLVDYLHLIKNKRKKKMSTFNLDEERKDNNIFDVSLEKYQKENNLNSEIKKKSQLFNNDSEEKSYKKGNMEKSKIINWESSCQEKYYFYFFFNTPKHYNLQANNLFSSTLQNEFHYSLTKFFSSFFFDKNKHYTNYSQYNNDQIKIYIDYIYDNINYAIDFFNAF
ncbi:conserved Plasmodium membrane protein, unknown function [Plasmodium relictum]|uniref:Uncharacterized protein n=1 Tax=Plasmodium relictum TaxID=85471 RepID=A0A1J1H997_PLARL|nr:conserved Plasmodium membrane protein, unknown function [Plasmodium relictum]CRH01545.1 conserved Plasmodium membrane protein, unknown function [Plasmodium relictum]